MTFLYTVTGGIPPYRFDILSGALPPGIVIGPDDGSLTGTPTLAGTYSWQARVRDAVDHSATVDSTVVISAVPVLTLTGDAPGSTVGSTYSYNYTAGGGVPPYVFSVASGALPPGLVLSAAGVLSGVPTTAGSYGWTVRVTDSASTTKDLPDTSVIAAGATDPNFANVSALLHVDGNLTDQKGHVWTPTGTIAYETASQINGSASIKFATTAVTLTSESDAAFNFGTGPFTLEFAIKFYGSGVGGVPAGYYFMDAGAGNLTAVQWNPTGYLAYYDPVTGPGGALYNDGPKNTTLTDGNVHRIAITRDGSGVIRAFCDGVMWGSQSGATHNKTHTTFGLNRYGGDLTHGGSDYLMDEIRITKGVCRYTANYTPSTAPFPNA